MKSHRRDITSTQRDKFHGGGILIKPHKITLSNRDSVFEKPIVGLFKKGKKATEIINPMKITYFKYFRSL